jgi:hypothetical protein
MTCKEIIYSEHAITQMFTRYITKSDVKIVIDSVKKLYPTRMTGLFPVN